MSLIPNAIIRVANYCTIVVLIDVIVVWEIDVALCMLFYICKDSCKRCIGDMCFAVWLRNNYLFTQAHDHVESELDILANRLNVETNV